MTTREKAKRALRAADNPLARYVARLYVAMMQDYEVRRLRRRSRKAVR